MKSIAAAIAAIAAIAPAAGAEETPRSFAAKIEDYLAGHPVAGLESYADFCRLVAQPPAQGTVDVTPPANLKTRRIRFWGALEHLALFKKWGFDAAEFDPDGEAPDVIFCHLEPGFSKGDVEFMLSAAARGTHVVVLGHTDKWSEALAARLGHSYGGLLNAPTADKGGVFFKNCPALFAGFPEGRLDAPVFPFSETGRYGMYLTGAKCLLGVADTDKCRVATAIAQYPRGKGAITLVGPYAIPSAKGTMANPAYRRILLNLAGLLPPVVREKPFDTLVYTRWKWHRDRTGAVKPKGSYHHFSTEAGAGQIARYFAEKGRIVRVTDDPAIFLTEAFRNCRCTVLACSNEEMFETEGQRKAFYAWAGAGGGTLAVHSASNCEVGRKEWKDFLGGVFLFHYPGQMPIPFTDADWSHPAMACIPKDYVWASDDVYVCDIAPGAVHPVLTVRVDQLPENKQEWIRKSGRMPKDGVHVLEWTKSYGKGRVYYTALGDNASDFAKPEFLEHLYLAAMWTARK